MKTIIPILTMMFLVGCGSNSMDQSSSTNSAAIEPPANASNANSPSLETTNAPAITNSADANPPATTNQ